MFTNTEGVSLTLLSFKLRLNLHLFIYANVSNSTHMYWNLIGSDIMLSIRNAELSTVGSLI